MTKKERYAGVIAYFEAQVPIAETELLYNNPFELLVAVILSAQCTDKRVNLTTPSIFAKFPTPQKMANASFDDMFALIKSISYPSNKSKHLIGMAGLLLSKFGGQVPMTVDELVELPGVGRKTANVITSVIDQQPNMAVDTHVFRVSNRTGLTKGKNPNQVEEQLLKILPNKYLKKAHNLILLHGRHICKSRNPLCTKCVINKICLYKDKNV